MHEAEESILDFREQNPTAYRDEIAEFLITEYGIQAHQSMVSRVLTRLNHRHKTTRGGHRQGRKSKGGLALVVV
jgi:arginine repressor